MTYLEMKEKVLAMIEELNPDSELLTDDPDIAAKYNEVTNQIMFEMARMKKISRYAEKPVVKGDMITFEDLKALCGREVYQLGTISGVDHAYKAGGTIVKILEDGVAEIDFHIYPERITAENCEAYVFELSPDCLEIMPYGVAGDLLKSDISTEYGSIYSQRYEMMLQRLDPRYHLTSVYIEGGVSI